MQALSVLHIGDTHRRTGGRADDIMSALRQIVAILAAWSAEGRDIAVLWPGDIFHGKTTTADRNAIVDAVIDIARFAPVVIVRGNHDEDGELNVLRRLETVYPVFVETAVGVRALTSSRGTSMYVFCLPYPHRAGLISAGVQKDETVDAGREMLDKWCRQGVTELGGHMLAEPGAVTCVAAHVNVAGAIASTGQPQIGKEIELAPESLDRFSRDTYIALNHIHKHQVIGQGVYAGSICRMDFSENDPKGVIEVKFFVPVASDHPAALQGWQFIRLTVPLQITMSCLLSATEVLWDDTGIQLVIGADVRVKYRYQRAESVMAKAQSEAIKAQLLQQGARSVKLIGTPIVTTDPRAPIIQAAATIDAKARAWCKLDGAEWTDALEQKLSRLLGEVH